MDQRDSLSRMSWKVSQIQFLLMSLLLPGPQLLVGLDEHLPVSVSGGFILCEGEF